MNKWQKYSLRIIRSLVAFIAIFVIVVAILISIARILTPLLNNYKTEFTQKATEALQRPTTIGSISAAFSDFEPVFVLKDVKVIIDPQTQQSITIPRLSFGINIFQSLIKRKIITGHITVSDIDLKAELGADGDLKIYFNDTLVTEKNTHAISSNDNLAQSEIWDWLLSQNRLALRNVDIEWSRYNAETLHLINLDAVLVNSGNIHKLRGNAYLSRDLSSEVSIGLDVTGRADNLKNITASLYIGGHNLPIGEWLRNKQYKNISLDVATQSDIKMWLDWSDETVQSFETELSLQNAKLKINNQDHFINIQKLNLDAIWHALGNGSWNISVKNLQTKINNQVWPENRIEIFVDSVKNMQALAIKNIEIQNISSLILASNLLTDDNRAWLASLQPQGKLTDITIIHEGKLKNLSKASYSKMSKHIFIQTNFKNLGINSYKKFPQINNVSGYVDLTPQKGVINLKLEKGYIDLPEVFLGAIPVSELSSTISWQRVRNFWKVEVNNFSANNDSVSINGLAKLEFDEKFSSPMLSLLAHVSQNDLSKLNQLIPNKILSPSLSEWLNQAFIAGKNLDSVIVYHGGLHSMPFNNNEGIFIADSKIQGLTLQYAEKWPTINNTDINLLFRNDSMFVHGIHGDILGANVKQVDANIPYLAGHGVSKLAISAILEGDSKSGIEFVAQSPLHEHLKALNFLDLTGFMKLDLNLLIPLKKNAPGQKTNGILILKNNTLTVPSQKLMMQNVNGNLSFTNDSLFSSKITGKLFDYPTKIQIKTTAIKNVPTTSINISGHITKNNLLEHINSPLLNNISGETDYNAVISLSEGATTLTISSMLEGLQVQLPFPYAKASNVPTDFNLSAKFLKNETINFHATYGELLDGILVLSSANNQIKFFGGAVRLGKGKAVFSGKPNLTVTGYLPEFDWDVWKAYINTANSKPEPGFLDIESLRIDKLSGFNQKLTKVTLWLKDQAQGWFIKISSDMISGTVLYPYNLEQDGIVGAFSKLHMAKLPHDANKPLDPSNIPKIDLKVTDFLYDTRAYQNVTFNAKPINRYNQKGINVETLALENKDISINAKGYWILRSKTQETQISGTANIADLGELLQNTQITDKFKSGSGDIVFDLNWPDSPENFKLSQSKGSAKFNLSSGRIVDLDKSTESKIGLGKVITALSLTSLLNIEAIGKGGYSYSGFKADVLINKGKISSNDAKFQGPVADISIQGDINTANERYNLYLKITPHLTSSLPLLAGVLINPVIGGVAWLADKFVVSPSVGAIANVQYSVTGPFSNPVVTKIGGSNQMAQQGKK